MQLLQRIRNNPLLEGLLWLLGFLAIMVVGYLLERDAVSKPRREVRIGYVSWAEGVAMTFLTKAVLEEKLGCNVSLTMADPAPIFTSLAGGDLDYFLDAWLPVTHQQYMDEYGETLSDLGLLYEGARIGLVVPAYVNIKSLPELADNADVFQQRITGIDSGAGIMQATSKALQEYDLPMSLVASSGAAMTASLKSAIQENRPIVVTGWKPHWMFARWNLRFLEDPAEVYGAAENIHALGRPGVARDLPDVTAFIRNMRFTDQQIGSLIDAVAHGGGDRLAAASEWMQEHETLVENWLP